MSETTEPRALAKATGFNEGAYDGFRHGKRGVLLPSIPGIDSEMMKGFVRDANTYINGWTSFAKALTPPPSALPYEKISFLPDPSRSGIIQPPGLDPQAIQKICRENIAPIMIQQMRVLDVMRYAQHSNHQWKPGWTIVMRDGRKTPGGRDLEAIRRCERFLLNGNMETTYSQVRERDAAGLDGFHTFLAKLTMDTLRYDMASIWTQMDNVGRVREFHALPGANMRLCSKMGYMNQPSKFAVLVDDTGSVQQAFTRQQAAFLVRNPRTDADAAGYGRSEVEMGVRLIQGFQNALDLNISTFDKNGIPNGMLKLTGDAWSEKPMDALSRMWMNVKHGITKYWALPAVAVPEDCDIELMNFMDLKDTDVRYKDHMNMVAGVFCTIYGFPVRRLGYHISGGHRDSEPVQDGSTDLVGDDDPGLSPLLMFLEEAINSYLVWSQFPNLMFTFTAKSPKEDARQYEARRNSMVLKEHRAENDLSSIEETMMEDPNLPEGFGDVGAIMDYAPVDSNLAAVYQTAVSGWFQERAAKVAAAASDADGAGGKKAPTPGRRTGESKDPAASEARGKLSGVRRDSARETSRQSVN